MTADRPGWNSSPEPDKVNLRLKAAEINVLVKACAGQTFELTLSGRGRGLARGRRLPSRRSKALRQSRQSGRDRPRRNINMGSRAVVRLGDPRTFRNKSSLGGRLLLDRLRHGAGLSGYPQSFMRKTLLGFDQSSESEFFLFREEKQTVFIRAKFAA